MKKNQIASIFLIILFLITSVYFSDKLSNNENVNLSEIIQTDTQLAQSLFVPSAKQYEVEAGSVSSPMTISTDSSASDGKYVVSDTGEKGEINLNFNIDKTENYYVWGRVLSSTPSTDSFYVSIDGGIVDIWDTAENTWSPNWQWTRVTGRIGNETVTNSNNAIPRIFALSLGQHNIKFSGREAGTKLDKIVITNDPNFVPTDSAPTITAPASYTLSVTKSGTGSGTVTGGNISCGTTCSQTSVSGTTVTLTATPASGSTFSGWSGACTGTGSCDIKIGGNLLVNASFILDSVSVQIPPTLTADIISPQSPTNLIATNVSKTSISIGWTRSTDNVKVVGYKVYRDGVYVSSPSRNTFNDSNRTPGTKYVYTVIAVDSSGNISAPSQPLEVTTIKPTSTTFIIGDSVKTNSPANVYSSASTNRTLLGTQVQGSVGKIISGPTWNNTYWWWKVNFNTGVDGWVIESYIEKPTTVLDTTSPSVPNSLALSSVTQNQVGITWANSTDNVGVAGYKVFRNGTQISTATTNSYADSGLNSATTYTYNVSAFDAAGNNSALSSGLSVATSAITPASYTLSVTKSGTGSGTVTGGNISCGTTCSQTSVSGTTVTLTATPASGSTFSGWSGACTGTGSCSVNLTSNVSISAAFTLSVVTTPPTTIGTVWYAATNGTASGNGSISSPWDLKTALAGGNGKILAGHTLYLRGGTYTGLFTSTLTGTNASPIVVRSAPGEWAVVDGATFTTPEQVTLQVNGGYVWYRDFEVKNSNPDRPNTFPYRPATLNVYGNNTKFINMVVHDGGQGVGLWSPATDSEIYGSIIYNNGGEYRDHGIYTQNDTSTKLISDNIIANNYGYGIHAYGSGSALLMNYTIDNNTLVNNPSLIGNRSVRNMSFRNNSLYNASFNFGYNNPYNQVGYIENNYFVSPGIDYMGWKDLHVRNNTFWRNGEKAGALTGVTFYTGFSYSDIEFSNNTYIQFDPWESTDWGVWTPAGAKGYKYSSTSFGPPADGIWQSLGYDADTTGSKYVRSTAGRPTGKITSVKPNKYEDGRALVNVYNWDLANEVGVSLNGVCYSSGMCLKAGDTFTVRNGLNYLNESITLTSDANNVIKIPMTGWTMAMPIGTATAITDRPSTFPEFGTFVIIKK